MNCRELLRALNEFLDGEVDTAICREFQAHLEDCGPCRVVVDTTRRTIRLYRGRGEHELPRRFRERLHRALHDGWKKDGARKPGRS